MCQHIKGKINQAGSDIQANCQGIKFSQKWLLQVCGVVLSVYTGGRVHYSQESNLSGQGDDSNTTIGCLWGP